MKYALFILMQIFLLLFCKQMYSQDFLYDDCNIGSADIGLMAGTYNNAWTVTHGTPTYTAASTDIFLWHDGIIGEGVVRKFQFKPNSIYKVTLGLNFFNNTSGLGSIEVKLVNSYPEYYYGAVGSPIPTFSGSRSIFSSVITTFTDPHNLCLVFKTGPSESYEGIAIYPRNNTNRQSSRDDVSITCLGIDGCIDLVSGTGGATFCANTIPAGIYGYLEEVNVGSSFCSTASFTSNDPSSNTVIESAAYIEVKENTLLTPGNSGYVLLNIRRTCPQYLYEEYPFPDPSMVYISYDECSCLGSRPAGIDKITRPNTIDLPQSQNKEGMIEVFPNPTSQYLEYRTSPYLQLKSIKIYSKMGKLAKEVSYPNNTDRIDISALPPDNYYVEFHSETGVVRKKFTKI